MAQPHVYLVTITPTLGAEPQRYLRGARSIFDVVCDAARKWPTAAQQHVRMATDIEQLQRLGLCFPRADDGVFFQLPALENGRPTALTEAAAPPRRRRPHPLSALVLWLGMGLCACLMALVWTLGQLPSASQLESTHISGMKYGYELCMAWEEQEQEAKAAYLAKGL